MKKILLITALALTLTANAQAHDGWRHGGGHYVYRGGGYGWVAPVVIGGVIGYELSRPRQPDVVVVQPQPIYSPPPPPAYQAPYGYHWEAILDSNCNCYRSVLVPN